MEHLTRKMLRGFPNVRAKAETADVLQGSVLRLLHTLRKIQPDSTRSFLNLAAVHIRRELLDLARSFASRREAIVAAAAEDSGAGQAAGLDQAPDASCAHADDLEVWSRFHEMIELLPVEEREVMGLCFYHGWTQVQMAELFQVDERTVRKRWQSACMKLNRMLAGQLPNL